MRLAFSTFFRPSSRCFWSPDKRAALTTKHEISQALRPFYFIVHPDFFGNYPREKKTNEDSLKQLNAYLEGLLKHPCTARVLNVIFYLRHPDGNKSAPLRNVRILLNGADLHKSVYEVLKTCSLPTHGLAPFEKDPVKDAIGHEFREITNRRPEGFSWSFVEQEVQRKDEFYLENFLKSHTEQAHELRLQSGPLREEVRRLAEELVTSLSLSALRWEEGWGAAHHRGCLESFRLLVEQHPEAARAVRDRALVFGRTTGITLDGHVALSVEDVRHNWLTLLRSAHRYVRYVADVPQAERDLSVVLRGVCVDHRRFKPAVTADRYVKQLQKLTTALHRYKWEAGEAFAALPRHLNAYKLGVECEAGPLMLSPTGQFLAPASCPPGLLLRFLSENMAEATRRRKRHVGYRRAEAGLLDRCRWKLGLSELSRDDSVTPELVVRCCERLLEDADAWWPLLQGCHLHVSHYYSVLQDGVICIPWDWKRRHASGSAMQ